MGQWYRARYHTPLELEQPAETAGGNLGRSRKVSDDASCRSETRFCWSGVLHCLLELKRVFISVADRVRL